MKKITYKVFLAFVTSFLVISATAQAAPYTSIYMFGDSLSDNGNFYAALSAAGEPVPPSPPYYMGRFSNGPVWVEDLATSLGIPLFNYAYGGATTGTTNISNPLPAGVELPGLQLEIASFSSNHSQGADENALYIVWAGGNDYLFTTNTVDTVLNNIGTAIKNLSLLGAKNFLVLNIQDLGKFPVVNGGTLPHPNSYYTSLINAHNAGLLPTIYAKGLPSDVKITLLDVNSLSNSVLQNPTEYGLTNVTNACVDKSTTPYTVCSNPSEYFFWDEGHLSSTTNSLIAQAASNALAEPPANAVP